MVKFLGIDWAPLYVPIERRLQTTVVLFYVSMFTLFPILLSSLLLALLFTPFIFVSLAYTTWIIYDVIFKKTSSRGGRRWDWFRRLKLWHYYKDYFPVSLVKTCDLDPNRNYIFGSHPHGIVGCGAFCNFGTEATGFSQKFPGLKPHLMTLKSNFKIPVARGPLLWQGICDVSKESIQWLLTKQGKGNVAIIVIGGAEEALESKPGSYKLTLLKRKGFVKQAIVTGASLVPVFSFGENDLYNQAENPKGSWIRYIQEKVKEIFGISPPAFYGRGVLNYSFGLMPHRIPINTVVGTAIDVKQMDVPDQETIDKYHSLYLEGLTNLFEKNKTKYGVSEDKKLNFV